MPLEKQTTSYTQYDYNQSSAHRTLIINIQKTLCICNEVKSCCMGHSFIAALLLIHVIMT